jgi:hypothetical protein
VIPIRRAGQHADEMAYGPYKDAFLVFDAFRVRRRWVVARVRWVVLPAALERDRQPTPRGSLRRENLGQRALPPSCPDTTPG